MEIKEIAALTIVSKNYLSCARVLCDSFLEHHPDGTFFVLLVDRNDGYIDPKSESFELLELSDIGLPFADVFPYQYNILELNTAVKPFALRYLFQEFGFQKLAYIDPDITIYDRLSKVWDGLDEADVVLTPHMREPYDDGRNPSELAIIQSGTYNLGFIGLRIGEESDKLLQWWSSRLYLNCVVDVPRGLFTDQKWMDLVPTYFENVKILHAPEYNIAYWNLHERNLSVDGDSFFVDGSRLAFFHFSGFDPRKPSVLSKHQDRHTVKDSLALETIFDDYANRLFAADLINTKEWPYAFGELSNGVKLSDPIHYVVRECLEKHVDFPSPLHDADSFCSFLATPNRNLFGTEVAPLIDGILHCRTDVANVFPHARFNKHDNGIMSWIKNSGPSEMGLQGLMQWLPRLTRKNDVVLVADIYNSRKDLVEVYPDAFTSRIGSNNFEHWLEVHGVVEYEEIDAGVIEAFKRSQAGVFKILNLYFGSPDLQSKIRNISSRQGINQLKDWAFTSLDKLANINENEIEYFCLWSAKNEEILKKANIMHNCWIREQLGARPNIVSSDKLSNVCQLVGIEINEQDIISWFQEEASISPIQHIARHYEGSVALNRKFADALSNKADFEQLFEHVIDSSDLANKLGIDWVESARQDLKLFEEYRNKVNILGYFEAATGMGESVRSMERILVAGSKSITRITLPNVFCDEAKLDFDLSGNIFGNINLFSEQSFVVANADSTQLVNDLVSFEHLVGQKIGFWVWETETFPHRWINSAEFFDEIWSSSRYSASAIETAIGRPVSVVPHCLDASTLLQAKSDRAKFGLPEDAFIFSFFFDQKSFIDRKNPEAILKAFDLAFADAQDVYLVIKVNTPKTGDLQYESLKSISKSQNVIWIEETLSRADCNTLMASIDSYVSLHRSEGFGLSIAEAMIMGKPTIASAYSGNMEFTNEQNSFLCDTSVLPLSKNIGPYQKGSIWGNPSKEHAARLMQEVYESKGRSRKVDSASLRLCPQSIFEDYLSVAAPAAGLDVLQVCSQGTVNHTPNDFSDSKLEKVQ